MPSPLVRNAPTPTSPQAQAPAAHTPAAPSPGPLQETSPPPGPQTPSTLRHGRSTVAQPAANPAHPQSEPGSPPATTPAAAPAMAGTALTGTAAGPTDPSFAAATTAAAAARGRMGPAMQRDSAPAAAAPATPSLPLREPTANAAIPTTLSPGSAPGPAPARNRTPMRGGSAEWRVGPKTVPAAVSAAAPAAGLEPRLTGWAASASRRLPPGLRYPAKAEHAGGRELGGEARVVPFLTARRRVPLELAGDRSDAPGLRPRGPCVTAGRGIKGGGPECMGEGRAGGPRVFKVLQLCCGAGCFSLQDWFGPQDDGGSGTGSGDGGGGGGSGGGADGSSGGRSDGRGAGVSSGSGGGSGGLRDLPPLVDCWAVDLNKNACVTFKANNRGADVVRCRVDEYLELVRRYNMLLNWLGIVPPHGQQSEPTAPAPSTAPAGGGFAAAAATAGGGGTSGGRAGGSSGTGTAAVAAGCGAAGSGDGNCCLFDDILAIRVSHCGRFGDNGQLLERLHPGNCWLEVLVQGPSCCDASSSPWQQLLNRFSCPGDPDPRVVWMPVEVLLRGPHASTVNVQLLRDFMAVLLEEDRLPLAGDVFAIMAGTPCQNVCAAVHKEKGAWVRNVYGRLQMLGYQYQLGDIAAGAHGASEGRQRAIVVGTDRGWPPPAFPCPVFEVQSHLKLLSLELCRPTAVPGQRLMPQPTLHDAISDLDPVSNWKMSPLGRSGSGAVESDGAAALGPVAATAAAGSGDGGTCAGSKDGDVVKGVGANGSPSPLQLAAATAKPPPHTTPRAARLAIAYGLGVFPLARLGRAARDLYDIERRHCLQQLRGASRLNVNTRAMAARAARVHGREGGAHAAGAGMAAAAAGTGAAAADCREREEEEARRRALERIGEVLLGDDGEPGPAAEVKISSDPELREQRQKDWADWIRGVHAEHAEQFLAEVDSAEAEFRNLAPGFIALLEAELRLANGERQQEQPGAAAAQPPLVMQQPQHCVGAAAATASEPPAGAGAPHTGLPGGGGGAPIAAAAGICSDGGLRRVLVANHVGLCHGVADVERFRVIRPALRVDTHLQELPSEALQAVLPCGHWLLPPPPRRYEQQKRQGPCQGAQVKIKIGGKDCRAERADDKGPAGRQKQQEQEPGQQGGSHVHHSKRGYTRQGWATHSGVIDSACCEAAKRPVMHPEQDRVLTVRDLARQHGIPDYYVFCTVPCSLAPWLEDLSGNMSYRTIVQLALRGLRFAASLWHFSLTVTAAAPVGGAAAPAANATEAGPSGAVVGGAAHAAAAGAAFEVLGQEKEQVEEEEEAFAELYPGPPRRLGPAISTLNAAWAALDSKHDGRRGEYRLVAESVSPLVSVALATVLRLAFSREGPVEDGGVQGQGQVPVESLMLAAARSAGWKPGLSSRR
ncbi:hypothetical protein PLESTB_001404400 [Pleodorina starrii]|uniref:DNA (cytosine-5-)-methyltransferase n=1 Tax=Pleodorina starrii TaxID=330485 RepID=A0A9W6BV78_9CHLO|nr:hypothetical protein PLESTB_001404400 [Pleodorina starrii]